MLISNEIPGVDKKRTETTFPNGKNSKIFDFFRFLFGLIPKASEKRAQNIKGINPSRDDIPGFPFCLLLPSAGSGWYIRLEEYICPDGL